MPSEPLQINSLATSLVRYLDVSLVVAMAPVVVLGNLPVAGYAIGAVAWLLTRYAVEVAHARARRSGNAGREAALVLSSMMARVFAIVAAVLVARFVAGRDDGITAAVVVLAAFTVRLHVTLALRGDVQRPAPGGSR
jgi:hypothetical protein